MALKLLLLFNQEFVAAFQEDKKNVVLLTNLRQKLSFGIQKTVHANFAKIASIKQVIRRTGYLLVLDPSVIWESLFKNCKAEFCLFANAFWLQLVSYENQLTDLPCKFVDWVLCDAGLFAGRYVV